MNQPIHILLVDDDEEDRMFFEMALSSSKVNASITEVHDGMRFLQFIHDSPSPPDVVFLDINMPLRNGLECLETLRSQHEYDKVPVLMYSTCSNEQHVGQAYSLGANRYVRKAQSVRSLTGLLKEIFSEGWQERLREVSRNHFLIEAEEEQRLSHK